MRARRVQEEARRIVRDALMAELPAGVEVHNLEARDDELLAAIRDLERADAAIALEQRWRRLAPAAVGSVSTAEAIMHCWRHALVRKALAEDTRRLLFLGRRRLCRALGIRPDTEDGGSDPLENLFVAKASPAVAAFFSALCGEERDPDGRAASAAEGLRSPELGSISHELRPLIDHQTRLRHRRQDLGGVVEAAAAAWEGRVSTGNSGSGRWVEEELGTPWSRTSSSESGRTESDRSEAALCSSPPGLRRSLKRLREEDSAP